MREIKELKEGELLQIKSDTLFHDLINENEMDTIEWIVMQILECSYEEITGNVVVNNIRLPRVNKKERNKYVDLTVSYKNEKIIIELNNNFDGIYVRNFLFGMNQLMNNYSLGTGNYYKEITRVILVNLNWFKGEKGRNIKAKSIYEIPYSEDIKKGFLFKMINVNLDYYSKISYDNLEKRDKLYKLLTIKNQEELDSLTEREKLLNRYKKKLVDLSLNENYVEDIMSEEMEEFIEKHTMYHSGLEVGLERGIEKGIQENQKEVVLNMHQDNVDLDIISKYTKLSVEEIKQIIKENSKS